MSFAVAENEKKVGEVIGCIGGEVEFRFEGHTYTLNTRTLWQSVRNALTLEVMPMTIELGDNGLRARYWWTSYDIPGIDDPIQAAYLAVRQRCPFLTDDNHTWEAKDYGESRPEYHKLIELTQPPRYAIRIFRAFPTVFPGNHFRPAGSYWFHFGYRVPE